MEDADCAGAAADAQATELYRAGFLLLHHLDAGLVADHRLEVAHHGGIGMRARRRADAIERVGDNGDPNAQGFVHLRP